MTKLESFIEYLRQFAQQAPPIKVVLPPTEHDFPEGEFFVEPLLLYIADCLDKQIS